MLSVYNIIQKLKVIGQQSLFKAGNKLQQPLLNNNDILSLLLRVISNKQALSHKYDISFRNMGDVQSHFRGHGMDYEESRPYIAGDDPRYMNWQLSARTGQHYMKVFREERQPGVFILVDRRYTMRFGTQKRLKITQAARAAAIAAFTAQENNFSIGGVILDSEIEWFKENKNKQAVFDFIHRVARPAIPLLEQKPSQQPNLASILRMLNEILTTGSKVYLISDFFDLDENSQPALLQLSTSHEVNAIHIIDKAEIELPQADTIYLKYENRSKLHHINSSSLSVQNKYKSESDSYFFNKNKLFKNIAIHYQQIFTSDENIESKIK